MKYMVSHGHKIFVFVVLCVMLFVQVLVVHAQPGKGPTYLPSVAPPSPEAASLGKYGDIPVSYHTGVPNISVPLYELKEGNVTLPVSLSYHASGVRVSEVASWVGLGWTLNAGGVITRSVQHVLDEGPLPNVTNYAPDQYPSGGSYRTGFYRDGFTLPPNYENVMNFATGSSDYSYSTWNKVMDMAQGNSDTEPDLFFFNIGGYSGKFLFKVDVDGSGEVTRTPVFIPKSDVKVEVSFGNIPIPKYPWGSELRETFIGFTLTTPDGFKYYFGGDSTAIEFTGSQVYNVANYGQSSPANLAPSSWYLTRIESPTGKHIDLEYVRDNYGYFDVAPEQVWDYKDPMLSNQNISRSVVSGLKLSKINSSTEEIVFKADSLRKDLSAYVNVGGGEYLIGRASKRLDRMDINKIDQTPVKKFIFNYSYFDCDDGKFPKFLEFEKHLFTTDTLRLRLENVIETSGDGSITLPPYEFSYIENHPLPRRISFQQDHWGYHNHETGNTGLISFYVEPRKNHRNTNGSYTQDGTLKSIKYPTGGTSTFTYESHKGYVDLVDIDNPMLFTNYMADSGLITGNDTVYQPDPFSTQVPIGGWDESSWCVKHGEECMTFNMSVTWRAGNYTAGPYDLNTTADIRTSTAVEIMRLQDSVVVARYEFGGLTPCGGDLNCQEFSVEDQYHTYKTVTRTYPINLDPNTYILRAYRLEGVAASGLPYVFTASVNVEIDNDRNPNYQAPLNHGLVDVGGLRIKSIITSDGSDTSPEQKKVYTYPPYGGQVFSTPQYYYPIKFLFTRPTRVMAAITGFVFRTMWASNSLQPMRTTQGNHIGYAWVKEEQVGNGYKVYSYDVATHPVHLSTDPFFQGNSYNYEAPNRLWTYPPYPAPLDIEIGNLLSEETFNNQDKIVASTRNTYEPANDDKLMRASKVAFFQNLVGEQTAFYVAYTHYPIFTTSNRIKTMTVNTNYDATGSNPTIILTTYNYDSQKHLLATSTVKTVDDVEYVDNFIYPPDYGDITTTTAGIKNLKEKNLINVPVEKYTIRRTAGATSGSVISGLISQYQADVPLQDALYSLKIDKPVLETSFNKSNKTIAAFNADSRYEKVATFHQYDALGNIREMSKENDIHLVYLWGYNNSRPIAEIKNATLNKVLHTSFEDMTTNVSTDFVTGSKSYSAAYNVVLPSSGSFNLTYWKKVGSGPWTFIETTISGNTSIGGSGILIDEVRLYPDGAFMTTYTYDPSNGMTSSTDVNNVTTYFEYDKLGRLAAVRDKDRNLLKTYMYHYNGQ
jgi:YD repeat-containing protein